MEANIKAELGSLLNEALLMERKAAIHNLRTILTEKVKANYIDSTTIVQVCRDILKIDKNDFLAQFFEIANSGTPANVAKAINEIDERENAVYMGIVLDFIIKSLREEYITPTAALLDRCSKIFTPEK